MNFRVFTFKNAKYKNKTYPKGIGLLDERMSKYQKKMKKYEDKHENFENMKLSSATDEKRKRKSLKY